MTYSHGLPPDIEKKIAGIFTNRFGNAGNRDAKSKAAPPPWLDPKPLPSGLLPVKPFNMALLPPSIGPWVEDISERMQCPAGLCRHPGNGVARIRYRPRIGIRPQRRTDWIEVPNSWAYLEQVQSGRQVCTFSSTANGSSRTPSRRRDVQRRRTSSIQRSSDDEQDPFGTFGTAHSGCF
jgi:hypothetical protein